MTAVTREGITNQKQRVATAEDCRAEWRGEPGGKAFRCYLCGHKFAVGDKWRWVLATHRGVLNFVTCESCDGDDVLDRWLAHVADAERRFWWMSRLP